MTDRQQMGANNPPEEYTLADRLAEETAKLAAEREAAMDDARRLPKVVADDDAQVKVAAAILALRKIGKKAEAERTDKKAPFLESGRQVDAFFAEFLEGPNKAINILLARSKAYLDEKAKRAREEQEARAKLAREEAEKQRKLQAEREAKAAAATKPQERALLDAAAENAAGRAEAHERLAATMEDFAENSPASQGLTKGAGATAGLKKYPDFRVPDYGKVDLNKLAPYFSQEMIDKAIKAHMRVHKISSPVDGIEFFMNDKAVIR